MAFNYGKLRGLIKEHFGTQEAFAKALGISTTSLSMSLANKRPFTQYEISRSMQLLNIAKKDVDSIFFTL